jgi:hypothetical protein
MAIASNGSAILALVVVAVSASPQAKPPNPHLTVYDGYIYAIQFVHRADLPVDDAVQKSIDSLCPKKGR